MKSRFWFGLSVSFTLVTALCLAAMAWLDRPVAEAVTAMPRSVQSYAGIVSRLGKSELYLVPALVCFLFFRLVRVNRRLAGRALFVALAVSASGLANWLVKALAGRYRPSQMHEADLYGFSGLSLLAKCQSFPSGHTNTVAAAGAALCFFLPPRYRWVAATVLAAVAADRVFSLAHFPSDVLFGAYLAVVVTLMLRRFWLQRGWAL